ncbi:hypothetical protein [Streptomyces sp. NPDC046161]|uniref:hypothetical protein n=1 Tax=Streptomyces sp. NPDC046161 TaxID=3155132 RepID=UPI0033D1A269
MEPIALRDAVLAALAALEPVIGPEGRPTAGDLGVGLAHGLVTRTSNGEEPSGQISARTTAASRPTVLRLDPAAALRAS